MRSVLIALALLASMGAKSEELYFDVGTFSDDGAVTTHDTFKLIFNDLKSGDMVDCFAKNKSHLSEKYDFFFGKSQEIYHGILAHSSSIGGEERESSSTLVSKLIEDMIAVVSVSDGHVVKEVTLGSKEEIELRNELSNQFEGVPIDMESAVDIEVKDRMNVLVHALGYEIYCDFLGGEGEN